MGIRIGGGVGPVSASVGTGGCLEALGALILIGVVVYVGLIALAIALTVVPIILAVACAVYTLRWLVSGRPPLATLYPQTRQRLVWLWVLGPLSIGWLMLVHL